MIRQLFASFLAAGATGLFTVPASAGQIDVGVGTGCETDTITGALLLALGGGADVIRLTTTVAYTNVSQTLTNWDNAGAGPLTISGGWSSCTATGTPAGHTTVTGGGSNAVFSVEATAGRSSLLTFRRLRIIGGGRGVHASGNSEVSLQSTVIELNDGGILATTGADVHLDFTTFVRDNSATLGGGINCSDPGSMVTIAGVVNDNQASGGGGGVFAQNGCSIVLADGADIRANEAPFGAGLFVQGGASVTGGGEGFGAQVRQNVASGEGGGFRVVGAGSNVLIGNVRVRDNVAGNRGGGVSVINDASFQLERFNFLPCNAPPRCAVLSGNSLTSGGDGSAAYAAGGGAFRMYQGFIEGNSGPLEAGFVLFAEDEGSQLYLEGIQIWNNRTVSMFEAQDNAEIVAGFVSAARNDYLVSGGPTRLDSRGAQASGGANVELYSSILIDQREFVANTGTVHGDCLIVDTAGGLTTSTGLSMVGVDPRFRNADQGNLRLRLDSPAIDSCDTSRFSPIDSDYDVDARGWDLASKPNVFGPFDRGADEQRPLFADGFETGSTGSWSAVVP